MEDIFSDDVFNSLFNDTADINKLFDDTKEPEKKEEPSPSKEEASPSNEPVNEAEAPAAEEKAEEPAAEAEEPKAEEASSEEEAVKDILEAEAPKEEEPAKEEQEAEEPKADAAEEVKEEVEAVAAGSDDAKDDADAEAAAAPEENVEADAPAGVEAEAAEPAEPVVEVKKTRKRRSKKAKAETAKAEEEKTEDAPASSEINEDFINKLILVIGPNYKNFRDAINDRINKISIQPSMAPAVIDSMIAQNNELERMLMLEGQGYYDAYTSLTDKETGLIAETRAAAEAKAEGTVVERRYAGQRALESYKFQATGEKVNLLRYANALKQITSFLDNAKSYVKSTGIALNTMRKVAA